MAYTLPFTGSLPTPVRASIGSTRKPDPTPKKPGSFSPSPSWWAPLFGWSSDAEYLASRSRGDGDTGTGIEGSGKQEVGPETGKLRTRYTLGCFTEEKAKELRRKTMEGSTFHDAMYHSAIASRLASDLSGRPGK